MPEIAATAVARVAMTGEDRKNESAGIATALALPGQVSRGGKRKSMFHKREYMLATYIYTYMYIFTHTHTHTHTHILYIDGITNNGTDA